MKKYILMLCMIWSAAFAFADGITFEKPSLAPALAKAKAQKKMVFIDAFATWCGPCKWMAKNIFTQKEVADWFNANTVSLSIDVERGEGPAIKTRYATKALPTWLFLDGEGNVLYRGEGGMSKEKFLAMAKEAQAIFNDPNNVKALAAQYESKKNDAKFLKTYIDKLRESGATGYYDVVEQYLKIQNTMKPQSGEMVNFLYKNIYSLTFGGKADEILSQNLWTYPWDAYVRKDIREKFQQLPRLLANQTTEYAILKKDPSMLDMAINRVEAYGEKPKEGQKERLLIYYYAQTGEGEKYKALQKPHIDQYANEQNVDSLRAKLADAKKRQAEHPNWVVHPYAEINSQKLRNMVAEYARFINKQDYPDALRWATKIYKLYPEDADNVAFYAKAVYLAKDKKEGIALLQQAIQAAPESKKAEGYKQDLEAMQQGKIVYLNY